MEAVNAPLCAHCDKGCVETIKGMLYPYWFIGDGLRVCRQCRDLYPSEMGPFSSYMDELEATLNKAKQMLADQDQDLLF